jgi:hypothetical protein
MNVKNPCTYCQRQTSHRSLSCESVGTYVGGILRLMDAGELLVWARFGTFVPDDQEDESPRKVTSGMADWMFRNLTEFPGCIIFFFLFLKDLLPEND